MNWILLKIAMALGLENEMLNTKIEKFIIREIWDKNLQSRLAREIKTILNSKKNNHFGDVIEMRINIKVDGMNYCYPFFLSWIESNYERYINSRSGSIAQGAVQCFQMLRDQGKNVFK